MAKCKRALLIALVIPLALIAIALVGPSSLVGPSTAEAVGPEDVSLRDDPRECGVQSLQFRFNTVFAGDARVIIELFHNPYDSAWVSTLAPNLSAGTTGVSNTSPNPGGCVDRSKINTGDPESNLIYPPDDLVLIIEARLHPREEWQELGRISHWAQDGHFANTIHLLPLTPDDTLKSFLNPSLTNSKQLRFRYDTPTVAREWSTDTNSIIVPTTFTASSPIPPLIVGNLAKDTPAKTLIHVPVAQTDQGATRTVDTAPGVETIRVKVDRGIDVPFPFRLWENETLSLSRTLGIPIEAGLLMAVIPWCIVLMALVAKLIDAPMPTIIAGMTPIVILSLAGVLNVALLWGCIIYCTAIFLHLRQSTTRDEI